MRYDLLKMGVCSFNAGARDISRCVCNNGIPMTFSEACEVGGEKEYFEALRKIYYSPQSGKRWNDPDSLDTFLIGYGMARVLPSGSVRTRKLARLLHTLPRHISKIEELRIDNADLNDSSHVYKAVRGLYVLVNSALRSERIMENATAVGKVLHILQPELLVIWDNRIREPRQFERSFDGYWNYLKTAQKSIIEALEDYRRTSNNPNATVDSIEEELYEGGVKPVTKLYDEACWAMVQGWLHFS